MLLCLWFNLMSDKTQNIVVEAKVAIQSTEIFFKQIKYPHSLKLDRLRCLIAINKLASSYFIA